MTSKQMERFKILAEKLLDQTANILEVKEYLSLLKRWNFEIENRMALKDIINTNAHETESKDQKKYIDT